MSDRTPAAAEPPFGTYAPGPLSAAVRRVALGTAQTDVGRQLRSILFDVAGFWRRRPFDVTVFGGEKARLHAYDNLSEKRVLRSDVHWDASERAFIEARAKAGEGVFRFLDVGANAGLYTLAAHAAARAAGRVFRAVAVEPQPEMVSRLRFNLAASHLEGVVTVLPWAAAREPGHMTLAEIPGNRGEARRAREGESGLTVEAHPLEDACKVLGGVPDVMKIDIEGDERLVLDALFDAVAPSHWPRAVVIEAPQGDLSQPGVALCVKRGYRVAGTTRMNALLLAAGA